MKARVNTNHSIGMAVAISIAIGFTPLHVAAEDIDIFISATGVSTSDNPNVLIILDNTSNWSKQAQHWPGGITQGQSELLAIRDAVNSLGGGPTVDARINIGLMMFTDNGSGREGGYVRYAIRPMTAPNKQKLSDLLTTIYTNFGTPYEKGPSSATYSAPLFDAFKYFGGYSSRSLFPADVQGTPWDATHFGPNVFNELQSTYLTKADPDAYVGGNGFKTYLPPVTSSGSCALNYIIFIGNGFPNQDDTAQTNLNNYLIGLNGLFGLSGNPPQLSLPQFKTGTSTAFSTDLGYNACSKNDSIAPYTSANCAAGETPAVNLASATHQPTAYGSGSCKSTERQVDVSCSYTVTTVTPVGAPKPPTSSNIRYADEWTWFLNQYADVSATPGPQNITTYTIDVFNAAEDANQTALLMSMAHAGGGSYYSATNQNAIKTDLQKAFTEILAKNSTFASATLPVSASNRTVNDNQVFIGVFRPDATLAPRWFGNLKQYKLVPDPITGVALADSTGAAAVNPTTGFITECATSFWTTDSSTYWSTVPLTPSPAGSCLTSLLSKWSDSPDGPKVEKGAVAEVVRKGNNPPATNANPTWAVNRSMNTLSGSSLTAFTTSSSGLSSDLVNFTLGQDVNDENGNSNVTEARPSLHGDVIHSRPLAIDYGGSTKVVVYYGANDGTLRAVDGASGKEIWSFVASEFFLPRTTSGGNSPLQRLMDNSPLVSYGTTPLTGTQPRDYLFDGSIGIYQNADSSKVWIYPTMRRGGRMIYGLDVTAPGAPAFKWKFGCPNQDVANNSGCTAGAGGVGQTWSTPNLAFIKGYSTATPIVAVGGGYDPCEDANTSAPSCSSPKGNHVYVIDADTGTVLRTFDTERSVIADIAFADVNFDGYPDYAYAVDTGGSIYRIDFVDASKNPVAKDSWTIHTVAYTSGGGRKFQYAPALLPNEGKVYLALGSGDREHPLLTHYPYANPVTNRFYVYLDDTSVSPPSKDTAVNLDSASFQDFTPNPTCGGTSILPNSSQKGWYLTLNQHGPGEQTVTSAAIAGGMVTFSTNRACLNSGCSSTVPTTDVCAPTLGEARGYFVNLFTGSGVIGVTDACGGDQSSTFVGGGLPPSPVLATVIVNGKTDTVLIGAIQKGGGPSSVVGAQKVIPPLNFARKMIYWFTQGNDNR